MTLLPHISFLLFFPLCPCLCSLSPGHFSNSLLLPLLATHCFSRIPKQPTNIDEDDGGRCCSPRQFGGGEKPLEIGATSAAKFSFSPLSKSLLSGVKQDVNFFLFYKTKTRNYAREFFKFLDDFSSYTVVVLPHSSFFLCFVAGNEHIRGSV